MFKPMCAMVAGAFLLAVSFDSNAVILSGGGGTESTLDCTTAVPSVGVIWPPDHSMVPVTIMDVTDDPGAGPITIAITSIYQDEPVLVNGSGNTQPDGVIQGSTAYVRAERAGPGTGRLYFITFNAVDAAGYSCSYTVQVQVPHDQGQGFIPIDTNDRYDSTVVTTN